MLAYGFTMPDPDPTTLLPDSNIAHGLGLRRVQYTAIAPNVASSNAALRMGFKSEGTLRNFLEVPSSKEASCWTRGRVGELPYASVTRFEGEDRTERGCGTEVWFGGISWEEWEAQGGVRELAIRQMTRKA